MVSHLARGSLWLASGWLARLTGLAGWADDWLVLHGSPVGWLLAGSRWLGTLGWFAVGLAWLARLLVGLSLVLAVRSLAGWLACEGCWLAVCLAGLAGVLF